MDLSEFADNLVAFIQAFWLGILVIGAGISIRERFWEHDLTERRFAAGEHAPDSLDDDVKGPGLYPGA
jgi:hypothetical protein